MLTTNKRLTDLDLTHLVVQAQVHTVLIRNSDAVPHPRHLLTVFVDAAPPQPQAGPGCATCRVEGGSGVREVLPSWAALLNVALLAAGHVAWDWLEADLGHPPRPLDPAAPLAFGEVLLPFIYAARHTVREQTGPAYALLDDATHRVLERSLLARLTRLCHPALEVAYLAFRTQPRLALARLVAPSDDLATALYNSFVMEMLWGELLPFCTREPLLAWQAALLTEGWVTTIAALVESLSQSRPVVAPV